MAQATLHKTLQGHTHQVNSVAFSPDNKLLASASNDKTVRLWNIPNGELNAELKGHESGVLSVAFSPDGKSIVTGSADRTVQTWSVATKQQVHSVAWSPTGDLIASGGDYNVLSVSFSPNGNKLASAGFDNTAIIWHVNSGAALIKLAHSDLVLSVCFSHDDQFVVTGCGDKIVRIFDANTGREEKQFKGHTGDINSVACSFDGSMIVSGSSDKSVRLWDVISTKQLQQLDGHTNTVTSVAFSCDGQFIASGSADKTVRLWNAPSSLQRKTEEAQQQQLEVEQQEINIDSIRECVSCQEIKDSSYLLPCFHAACSQCVADFVKDGKSCCCVCGEKFVQEKLTTVPSTTLLTPTCFDCDEPATHYCGECENNMCKTHTEAHRLSKRTKEHAVRLIAEVPLCHKHSTETALGFCTHCKVLVCGNCSISDHNKLPHLSVSLQEAAKMKSDSLKNNVAKLVESVPSINKEIQKYKNIRTKLEKERAELEDKIADIRKQEKVATLQIEDLENTKALLLTTQKQANALAASASTLSHPTLVRLQSVVASRITQLQTGLGLISGFFH